MHESTAHGDTVQGLLVISTCSIGSIFYRSSLYIMALLLLYLLSRHSTCYFSSNTTNQLEAAE